MKFKKGDKVVVVGSMWTGKTGIIEQPAIDYDWLVKMNDAPSNLFGAHLSFHESELAPLEPAALASEGAASPDTWTLPSEMVTPEVKALLERLQTELTAAKFDREMFSKRIDDLNQQIIWNAELENKEFGRIGGALGIAGKFRLDYGTNAMMERISNQQADLTAARARIAALEGELTEVNGILDKIVNRWRDISAADLIRTYRLRKRMAAKPAATESEGGRE